MALKQNRLMKMTKEQRKGIIPITVFFGLILALASQSVTVFIGDKIRNIGWGDIYNNLSAIVPILCILIYCKYVEKRKAETLGFVKKNAIKNYILGLIIGFILITTVFFINLFTKSINVTMDISTIKWWFIIFSFFGFIIQGLMEETICRGFIMNSIASKYGAIAGIVVNSIIFAALHAASPGIGILPAINLFLAGILFSVIFYYTDSIFVVAAIHTVWNFTLGIIYGVKVSGLTIYSSIFNTIPKENRVVINGGLFGFEGGLSLTLPLLLLLFGFIYFMKKRTWDKVISK
ncbi:CPBP family intramembrane glutamic endopeptidase [Lactococcus formosensis]|uniref:CPBP family intramembrane glutamic endopeptidase n=1 Tax=Lactococcus formosensis TaxID=1281486 RepID=UPI00254A7B80|nr:type II CAAX endopeptidase family protein [Lactococcus formosensis]